MSRCVEWLAEVPQPDFPPTKTLADVVPAVRPQFEALLARATELGLSPKVRSAGRTCEEQAEQVELGYSQADFCRSMHVLGHAVDLDLSPSTCASYTKLGEWWEARGGVWGGRWKQFGPCGDAGHYMFGFGGAGAVPTSVCPSGASLEQCREIRRNYLTAEFARGAKAKFPWALAGWAAVLGVGYFVFRGTLGVKPGARLSDNPENIIVYRGWKIEKTVATQLGYMIREGKDFGRGRKVAGYWIHYPDGGAKLVKTLKQAREYIDEYLGPESNAAKEM